MIFRKKMFLILHSIKWPYLIVCLPLLLEILRNMCIVIIFLAVYDVIVLKLTLAF